MGFLALFGGGQLGLFTLLLFGQTRGVLLHLTALATGLGLISLGIGAVVRSRLVICHAEEPFV